MLLDATLPRGGQNYRTLRFPWVGTPSRGAGACDRVEQPGGPLYASWNGSTELAAWQPLYGPSRNALAAGPARPKEGFETMLVVPASAKFAAVVALDRHGRQLARSATIPL